MRCLDDSYPFRSGDLRQLGEVAQHAGETLAAAKSAHFQKLADIFRRGIVIDPESCSAAMLGIALENFVQPDPGLLRVESNQRAAVRPGRAVAQHPGDVGITMNLDTGNIGMRGVISFQIADNESVAHLGSFIEYSLSTRNATDCYYGYMAKASLSDRIRDHARRQYIEAARRRREAVVQIVAGDVHRALALSNRVPVVCNALSSKAFLEDNRISLERREGPPSGLSTTVRFTYRLLAENGGAPGSASTFLGLRGAAKQVFQSLGGGEAFIRAERDQLDRPTRGRP